MPKITAMAAMALFLGFAVLTAPDDNVRLTGDGLVPLTQAIATISPPTGQSITLAGGQ